MDYIDFSVGKIIALKDKYGFRIKLLFHDGKEIVQQMGGFANRREANRRRDKILADLYCGTYVVDDSYTVKSFLDMWLKEVMLPNIKASTYATYFYALKNHIYPNIGNLKLCELNRGHIVGFYSDVAAYSISEARMCWVILKIGLGYAEQRNYISVNPAKDLQIPKFKSNLPYHTSNINSQKTLTKEELQLLITKSHGTSIYLYILFAGLMGLRKSEIRGLKYSDVDYINSTIHIRRQLGKVAVKEDESINLIAKQEISTKTKLSDRIIYSPKIVLEAIMEQRAEYEHNRNLFWEHFNDLDYICCTKHGDPHCISYSYAPFKRLLRDVGMQNIRFHDLRHTYATLLLKDDISPKAVSLSLGHAKTIVTIDVYGDNKQIIDGCDTMVERFANEILPAEICDFSPRQHFIYRRNVVRKSLIESILPKEYCFLLAK